MALTHKLTETIEIPHEPGQTITIRKLAFGHLEEARQARQEAATRMLASLGDLRDQLDNIRDTDAVQEAAQQLKTDHRQQYNQAVVLRHGITAWSYEDECNQKMIAQLDEATANWAFDTIINFSVRGADEMGKSAAS